MDINLDWEDNSNRNNSSILPKTIRGLIVGKSGCGKTYPFYNENISIQGKGILNNFITNLPFEMHLPGYNFAGPGTKLNKRLNDDLTPKDNSKPINRVDEAAYKHDICYLKNKDTQTRNTVCDENMLKQLKFYNPSLREKIDRSIVSKIIGTKKYFGMGPLALTSELANELHKPIIKKFTKRRVMVNKIDEIWTADLVDMSSYSKDNKGYKYLLTVIDVFSKYGWIVPKKNKKGLTTAEAFKLILKEGRQPEKLWVDKGTEFYNPHVKSLFKNIYSTENEEKSSVIERWNRTMKEKMFKYFTANQTKKYIAILPTLVNNYNNTYHNSIKMKPTEGSLKKNENKVRDNLYEETTFFARAKPKFKLFDRVRITKKKLFFEKGYTPRWTNEIFTINEIHHTNPTTYKLIDLKGEEIIGSFYEKELQRTKF